MLSPLSPAELLVAAISVVCGLPCSADLDSSSRPARPDFTSSSASTETAAAAAEAVVGAVFAGRRCERRADDDADDHVPLPSLLCCVSMEPIAAAAATWATAPAVAPSPTWRSLLDDCVGVVEGPCTLLVSGSAGATFVFVGCGCGGTACVGEVGFRDVTSSPSIDAHSLGRATLFIQQQRLQSLASPSRERGCG